MMLDFASAAESHRFGHHAMPRYGEACHSLAQERFQRQDGSRPRRRNHPIGKLA